MLEQIPSDAPDSMTPTQSSRAPDAGVLPYQAISRLIASGAISAAPAVDAAQIQPASLDLRLGAKAWRVRASFLAGRGRSVAERLAEFGMHEVDLTHGAALERGCVYVVPLMERLQLPANVSAIANAKSSTGRLDLLTRLITDGGVEFDRIDAGYEGPLYAEISPLTFSVLARPGVRLNQIRFRQGDARPFSDTELKALHARVGLVDVEPLIQDGLGFSVDLRPRKDGPVGYRARRHAGLIDLEKIGHYEVRDFWEPVDARGGPGGGGIILDPGAFYILVSREAVHVPPDCAAEMAPYLAVAGEFRVHYAGFFDPGFGHAATGGTGSRGVLEVRCHDAPFALEHGQIVGRLVYEPMLETPEVLYGSGIGSNYQAQGLRLSKHFRQ